MKLTVEESAQILSAAFQPLRCDAAPSDHRAKVRFQVFDSADQPLAPTNELARQQVANTRRLETIIRQTRNWLTDRGHVLDPWTFPNAGPGAA